ncbi:MAG: transcription termination/antitermination protein NusA [Elusimicrobia bacterium]|nr:transcription termination/antitermination protein NusA [Elusimicrobiota bacterium]
MATKSELLTVLDQIEREKGIKKSEILKMIEGALISALRKQAGKNARIEASIDEETALIQARMLKMVVETVMDPELEISFEEAKRLKPRIQIGTEIEIPIETGYSSRIAAQTAKQVIVQKIREVERENLYIEFKPKEGQVVSGTVNRLMDKTVIVDLGKVEGILPYREQIRKERFHIGERLRALIVKVEKTQKGPEIILSRASSIFLRLLFEMEVPEIADKTVEILQIVREPGFRAKILVRSHNSKVDPVGACVGIRGSRVRPITSELSGERIDLICYQETTEALIQSALSPAKTTTVRILDKENKRAEILVPDDMLSLAIGREGQNVRLASRLTGWNLDILSESQRTESVRKAAASSMEDLMCIEGIGKKTAETLWKGGYGEIQKIAQADPNDLTALQGIGKKTAEKIVAKAAHLLKTRAVKSPQKGPDA